MGKPWKQIKIFTADGEQSVIIESNPERTGICIHFKEEMDKQEFESKQFVSFKDQFQWFLFVGLFLIILDVVVFERKTYWLDKLNLFNENEKV